MSHVLVFSSVVAACVAGLTLTATAQTKPQGQRPLIIDMHMHAFSFSVDVGAPPPVALCFPLMPYVPPFDPKQTWSEVWAALLKTPPCRDPIWSPTTDEALIVQTVAILERRNVIGVLSGPPERLRQWREAAPGRFIPALRFQIGGDPRRTAPISVETFRQLVAKGEIAILAEVLNQYAGVGPDDPRLEPYDSLRIQEIYNAKYNFSIPLTGIRSLEFHGALYEEDPDPAYMESSAGYDTVGLRVFGTMHLAILRPKSSLTSWCALRVIRRRAFRKYVCSAVTRYLPGATPGNL